MSLFVLTDAIRDLTEQPKAVKEVPKPTPRGSKPASTSSALHPGDKTGAIAGPLTEADISGRTYHDKSFKSTDGLFSFQAIKSFKLTDANGAEVVINLASPK